MNFKDVNNKATDSIILSLENLKQEYSIVLNSYNQVQQELDAFANSQWTVNPYASTNIQFTTGEIAYVSKSGSVFLYSFLPQQQATIATDQTSVTTAQGTVNEEQPIVNQAQNAYNNAYNSSIGGMISKLFESFSTIREPYTSAASMESTYLANQEAAAASAESSISQAVTASVESSISQAAAASAAAAASVESSTSQEFANIFGTVQSGTNAAATAVTNEFATAENAVGNAFSVAGSELNTLFGGGLSQLQSTLNSDKSQLQSDQSYLNTSTTNLNVANLDYQDALTQLTNSGCPSLSNVTQINLPWLPEYSNPYNLIPTSPPLMTMGEFVFENGQIGFNGYFGLNNFLQQTGEGCNSINASLTSPPHDIIPVNEFAFTGTTISTMLNSTIELCTASCYVSPSCSGATFNFQNKTCTLNTGAGTLQPSSGNIALIPQITQYLLILSDLNLKLTDINEQIVGIIKKAQPDFVKYTDDDQIDDKLLKNRYTKLIEERIRIDKMIEDISKTQNEEDFESDVTNMNYFRYGLLIALAIIIIIIMVKLGSNNNNASSDMNNTVQYSLLFVISIVVVVVVAASFLKKYLTGTPL